MGAEVKPPVPEEVWIGKKVKPPPKPWRIGRKVGRTIYWRNVLIGLVDTPVLAAAIVHAMNEVYKPTSLDPKKRKKARK